MRHLTMTATACLVLLGIGFMIDYLSIGPDSLRDRVASCFALAGFSAGWADSDLGRWATGVIESMIGTGLQHTGSAYVATAKPQIILSMLVAGLWVYWLAALVPVKTQKFIGPFAHISFAPRGRRGSASAAAGMAGPAKSLGGRIGDAKFGQRINAKLWGITFTIAIMNPILHGFMRVVSDFIINGLIYLTGSIPGWLLGGA